MFPCHRGRCSRSSAALIDARGMSSIEGGSTWKTPFFSHVYSRQSRTKPQQKEAIDWAGLTHGLALLLPRSEGFTLLRLRVERMLAGHGGALSGVSGAILPPSAP